MINQNLEHIKLFLTVASASTLKEAAALLHVTPPAITQALKKFEQGLGVQLFLREHKKVQLTPQGKELKDKLLPLFQKIDLELSDFLLEAKLREPHGQLSIAAPFELGSTQLVQSFAAFQKSFPRVKAKLTFSSPLQIMERVATGAVDFGLMADGPHTDHMHPTLLTQKLFEEEMVLVCSKAFKQQHKFKETLEELMQLPHLDYTPEGSAVGSWYQYHFKKRAPKLNVIFSGENAISLLEGVKNNLGLAMLPAPRFKSELKTLHVIEGSGRSLITHILLVQHQNKVPTLAEKMFIEHLKSNRKLFE